LASIPATLPNNLSLALGSANLTPLQMASGYAVLANGGYRVEPYFIERIEIEGGDTIFEANPATVCRECEEILDAISLTKTSTEDASAEAKPETASEIDNEPRIAPRVIDERNRYLMYSMLQDVVQSGTATKAKALGRRDIAGKTGTTNDQRDAWFNGFNEHIVANAWVGFDDNGKLGRGEVGGRAALPAWMDYMRVERATAARPHSRRCEILVLPRLTGHLVGPLNQITLIVEAEHPGIRSSCRGRAARPGHSPVGRHRYDAWDHRASPSSD
jgi:penicillin-binding protein 1A